MRWIMGLAAAALLGCSVAGADPLADIRLAEIRAGFEHINTVKAAFTQEKHLKILKKPLVSHGVFYFRAPDDLRWEYTSPIRSLLLLQKGQPRRYSEQAGVLTADTGADLTAVSVVLGQITQWFGGRFDENDLFQATFAPPRTIVLTPRDTGLLAVIERIELVFSSQPGVIDTVAIHEGPNAVTRLIFQDVRLNQPLDDQIFLQP